MAKARIRGARFAGVATCTPTQVYNNQENSEQFDPKEVRKVVAMAGVKERRVAGDSVCSSDLCLQAAKRLLEQLDWEPESVDALIFVTQTPDYFLPSTSALLHRDLGLTSSCASFDVGLGCSGYPYGLWLGSMMLSSDSAKRVLVLHGETPSRFTHPDDRSTFLLFGDAGSATALEKSASEDESWGFCLHSDGTGFDDLIIPAGGFRQRTTDNERDNYVHMNGGNLFNFTVKRVPELIDETLSLMEMDTGNVDMFCFHQSNQFIMKHIAKKSGLPAEKVPIILGEFGNSGGPSVPLTLTQSLHWEADHEDQRIMMLGYGVGLSWGSALVNVKANAVLDHSEYAN